MPNKEYLEYLDCLVLKELIMKLYIFTGLKGEKGDVGFPGLPAHDGLPGLPGNSQSNLKIRKLKVLSLNFNTDFKYILNIISV